MKRVQTVKRGARRPVQDIDCRTPGGRMLPW